MNKLKTFIIASVILALCTVGCNTYFVLATENIVEENRVYLSGNTYTLQIADADKKVEWNISDGKKIKKVKTGGKYSQKLTIKAKSKGNCKITATCGKNSYIYYVHIEKKFSLRTYDSDKTKVEIVKAKKKKHYFVLRVKVSNGKKSYMEFSAENHLQKKTNGKWEDVEQIAASAGVGQGISPKTQYVYSVNLTGLYDLKDITKGKYRILFDVNGKDKYIYFKIK